MKSEVHTQKRQERQIIFLKADKMTKLRAMMKFKIASIRNKRRVITKVLQS